MINHVLDEPNEIEDMPRLNEGPLIPVKPILDWIARQPANPVDGTNYELIRKRLYRGQSTIGFHAADNICCKLKVPMLHVYGDMYWLIDGI